MLLMFRENGSMKHSTYQTQLMRVSLVMAVLVCNFSYLLHTRKVAADVMPSMLIYAIQTASTVSASDELVVLMNISDQPINLKDWELQYQSTAGSTWSVKSKLTAVAYPRQYYIVATNNILIEPVHDSLTAGMAGGGGHVRLVMPASGGGQQVDLLGWGTAAHPLGSAAVAPAAGQMLIRNLDTDDMPIYSGNNANDFTESSMLPELTSTPDVVVPTPSPVETTESNANQEEVSEVPQTPEVTPSEESPISDEPPAPTALPELAPQDDPRVVSSALRITELLPNPALPALDSEAEFVELFNSGSQTIQLEGYTLYTGSGLTFKAPLIGDILPGAYRSFAATEYRQALGNSTGRAELRFGDTIIDTSPAYNAAAEGVAWALIDGVWQWTATPTPAGENILNLVAAKSTSVAAKASPTPKSKSTTVKSTAKTGAKTTKTAATKTATSKASKTSETDNNGSQEVYEEPAASANRNIALLAGVGGLAILYGIYEYRHDLSNRIKRCRDYFSARRSRGVGITGR